MAGAFCLLIEMVPAVVAGGVDSPIRVPAVGVGAGNATVSQVLVWQDIIQRLSDGHRAEPVTAEPAHLVFHPAFLVRPLRCRADSRRGRTRDASGTTPTGLFSCHCRPPPEHHVSDGAGEIVVADVPDRHAADLVERFLSRRRVIRSMALPEWEGQPEDEHVALFFTPFTTTQTSPGIHLGFSTAACPWGNEHFNPLAGLHHDLGPADTRVVVHRKVRQLLRPVIINDGLGSCRRPGAVCSAPSCPR